MVTREVFDNMVVTDKVSAVRLDPLEIVTKLIFKRAGVEVGFATLFDSGNLYCHVEHLPLAIEWLINNYKHKQWQWKSR